MLYFIISIIGIFITIFFVIGTHESAHFFAARWLGVKVLRFSIGFGKTLLRWYDKTGTEYVIALIPLGGYVKMLDEGEGKVAPEELHLAFNRQPFYKKFLIVLAGPFINIFCALILYWLIFVIGFTTLKPIVGSVDPHSLAGSAGMKANQEIVAVDNKETSSWTSIIFRIVAHVGNQDHIKIEVENPPNKAKQTYNLDLTTWKLDELNPDPLKSLGITPYQPEIPLVIGIIGEDSPATTSGLKLGDKILAIDGKKIKDWSEVITTISDHPSQTLNFEVLRDNKEIQMPVAIGFKRSWLQKKTGYLGISPKFETPKDLTKEIKYGPIEAIPHAWNQIVDFTYFNLLLFGKIFTGKLSLQSMGGPITIFETAGESLYYGFLAFITFLAFLSISIGVINLLPIPGLDGGHLFFQIVELIIRRPIPENVLMFFYRMGFLLIIFVLIQALINDVLRMM